MGARELEAQLIDRCRALALGEKPALDDERLANVCRLAAMVLRSRRPAQAARLAAVSEAYFESEGRSALPAEEILRRGWVISLPRLRDSLLRALTPASCDSIPERR